MREKSIIIYAFYLMPSHLHMVAAAREVVLSGIRLDFKSDAAKHLINAITGNQKESKKE